MEMVTDDFLDEICELNKTGNLVLEFGLQTIHKTEMKFIDRPNNMSKVSSVLLKTLERGIDNEVSLIFGLPGQTLQSFQESVNFCISAKVRTIHAWPLMLLRGTPLYENKHKFKLIESNEIASPLIDRVQDHVIPHVVQSDTFSYADWLKMGELAEWLEREYNVKKE